MEIAESVGTSTVPQVVGAVVPEFSGNPGDLMADLALIAREKGQVPPSQAEVTTKTQQPPEITATAPVTVPEKLQMEDGSLDTEKLAKVTVDAEAALSKYLEKEKELRRKMNEVNGLQKSVVPAQENPNPPAPVSSFAATLEADIQRLGAGVVLEKLFNAAQETAYARALGDVQSIREESELSRSQRELEAIAKYDPQVLTPEGYEQLAKIREAKPWLNQSPKPWTEAYNLMLGDRLISERLKGTVQPNPTGQTAKAPPTPVSPAPRVVVKPAGPNLSTMNPDQITAYVKGLTPDQEKSFWASRGLRF